MYKKKKENDCQEDPKCIFFIALSLFFWLSVFGPSLSILAITLGRYECVAASSDQACDKG